MRLFFYQAFLGIGGLIFLVTSCKSAAVHSETKEVAAPAENALIMVANVENAFDGIDQGTEYPDFKSTSSNWTQEKAEAKARRVAEVFLAAKCPQIIVSPEVENQNAADMIAKAAEGCHYKAISANKDQKFPIGVAIFTSREFSRTSLIETGYRPHLRVDFADGLTVVGVHLKSQRDGGDDLRVAAADAIKKELAAFTGRRIIVAGDFNTEDELLRGTKVSNCTERAQPTHVFHGEWHRLDKIYSTQCTQAERFDAPFLMRNSQPFRGVQHQNSGRTIHEDEGYSDHLPLLMFK